MNTLTIILAMLAIIVICGAVIYSLIKMVQKNKKEIQSLNNELNSARENVRQLSEYIKNSDKIRKEEKEIAEKIKEAKTDEEVHNIINDIIGNETPIQTMKDCSVVTATYELGEGMKGTIGIIGPKRMDYKKVVASLDYFAAGLTEQISLPEVTAEAQGTHEERKTTHGGE